MKRKGVLSDRLCSYRGLMSWSKKQREGADSHLLPIDMRSREVSEDDDTGDGDHGDDDDGFGLNYKVLDMSTQIVGQNNI